MAKGKKNNKKAAVQQVKKAKQQAKHEKHLNKQRIETDEEDIETLILKLKDAEASNVSCISPGHLVTSHPPTPRAHASWTLIPSGEFLLFGGEFYDGKVSKVYNDVFRYQPEKLEWRKLQCELKPKPRCSHQALCFRDQLYIFGGEYTTATQFYHFRDMWKLDLKTNTWQELQIKGMVPQARSGHRMVVWRNLFILFGGFHDTARQTRYYNDLWIFCTQSQTWSRIDLPVNASQPSPRSGCIFTAQPKGEYIFMYGGYSKIQKTARLVETVCHRDTWLLHMKPLMAHKTAIPIWERYRKSGCCPSIRSGASAIPYKNLCVMFGGVFDQDSKISDVSSTFYNDLYAFDLERKKWYALTLKETKGAILTKEQRKLQKSLAKHRMAEMLKNQNNAATDNSDSESESEPEYEDEYEYQENTFGYIGQDGKLIRIQLDSLDDDWCLPHLPEQIESTFEEKNSCDIQMLNAYESDFTPPLKKTEDIREESDTVSDIQMEVVEPVSEPTDEAFSNDQNNPMPRISPHLAVKGNTLYVYGGLIECGHREVTLDDLWMLNLVKRDKWENLVRGSMDKQEWHGDDNEESESSEDDSDFDQEDGADIYDDANSSEDEQEFDTPKLLNRQEVLELRKKHGLHDLNSTPQISESRKEFFSRTRSFWMQKSLSSGSTSTRPVSGKDTARDAFRLASERFLELEVILKQIDEFEKTQQQEEIRPSQFSFQR